MADEQQPTELTIILRKPVTLGSETYRELTLREPTGAQWMEFDKLEGVEADFRAIALVSGTPEPAVRLIGVRDLCTARKFLSSFFD